MGIMTAKRRRTAGFTMSEMLIVIALITLMAAMSAPGLMSLKRDIEITRLDETAKEIYNAAQNSLTRASLGGELAPLVGGNRITNKPVDFSDAITWDSDGYHYAADGSAAAKLLLPLGSIDDSVRLGGNYIIEYDLKSGTIYAVFYSEKKELNYKYLNSLQFRGGRQTRRRQDIGYYGGGGINRGSFTDCATPLLTVINGNELKILIAGQEQGYTISALIEDEHGGSLEMDSLGDELLLDSLNAGERFREKCAGLTPGDDITVTVTFERDDNFLSSSAAARVNSLFAEKDDETGYKAEIGCARHLQNLDADWSGITAGGIAATQTANIDLAGIGFSSVSNSSLTEYNGAKQKISGLTGTNGIFTSLSNARLENIYVVNPDISGIDAVGALAGSLTGCTVTGCRAYAYEGGCSVYANGTAGGLIGSASRCDIGGSFAALYSLSGATGGGLIGSADTYTKITDSYASCGSLSGSGMLIGWMDNSVSANNCYAVGSSNLFAPEDAADAGLLVNGGGYYVYTDAYDGSSKKTGAYEQGDKPPYTRPYYMTGDYPYRAVGGLPHYGDWVEVADSGWLYFYLNNQELDKAQVVPGLTLVSPDNNSAHQIYNDMNTLVKTLLPPNEYNIYGWYYVVGGTEIPFTHNGTKLTENMILYVDYSPK